MPKSVVYFNLQAISVEVRGLAEALGPTRLFANAETKGYQVPRFRAKGWKVGRAPLTIVLGWRGRWLPSWIGLKTSLSHSIGSIRQSLCLPTTILAIALCANVVSLPFCLALDRRSPFSIYSSKFVPECFWTGCKTIMYLFSWGGRNCKSAKKE